MKKGLVMEGGAMRGLFTAGVTDVLMENGIEFDGAVGVSAGATFGCNVKSRQIGRTIRYNRKYCGDWRYGSVKSFLKTGSMFDFEFCYRLLPEKLDPFDTETFAANPMEFYVVATSLLTGSPVYYRCTDGKKKDLAWICASASMPLVSKTVLIGGRPYLDGGISDSIPLRFFESMGYDRNLVIETRNIDYVKGENPLMKFVRARYAHFPKFIEAVQNRHIMYNEQTAYVREQEELGNILVIRPPEALSVKSTTTDPSELQLVYEIGRKTAQKKLPEIRAFYGLSEDAPS